MTDNTVTRCVLAFVFLNEFKRTRKGDVAYITLKLILGHTDTVVRDRESSKLTVELYVYSEICFGGVSLSE